MEPQPEGAAEDDQATTDIPKPSKSNLVDKRTSMISKSQSHVRVVEPGQEAAPDQAPEADQKEVAVVHRKSDSERKKSDAGKRPSDTERKRSEVSREISVISGSHRGSKSARQSSSISKDGILRRHSDRPSKAKVIVGSTISIRRTQSGYGEYFGGAKAAKFMNTYKLESENPFHVERVEKILRDVLIEALDNLTYDADKCPKQAKWACSAIRARVKDQEYDRYKLVILVTIGEKRYQDMCSVVRFLWDIERDKYALFVHENMHVYAAALCFGIYYE